MLVHCCKSNVKFELSFQFVCMNSHGSLMWRSLPPLGYTFWCSVNTPDLLVVALHQALYLSQVFAFSSFIHHLLLIFLQENNMALAETSSFFTTLRLLYAG